MANDTVEIKIDVEVLKEKVDNITQLCNKMDQIIEKLVDNHDRNRCKGIAFSNYYRR
jgi:hypothetical protein